MDCYVCIQMIEHKPQWAQDGPSKLCLLCDNLFCAKHKGKDEGVCEINHETYYRRLDHRELHAPVEVFPTLEKWRERFGDVETAERVVGVAFCILFVAPADDADLRQRRELLDSDSD